MRAWNVKMLEEKKLPKVVSRDMYTDIVAFVESFIR